MHPLLAYCALRGLVLYRHLDGVRGEVLGPPGMGGGALISVSENWVGGRKHWVAARIPLALVEVDFETMAPDAQAGLTIDLIDDSTQDKT